MRNPGFLSMEIAGILRAELARRQGHQAEAAAATGISAGQLSKMFAGKKSFDLEDLDAVATAMGLDLTRDLVDPARAARLQTRPID